MKISQVIYSICQAAWNFGSSIYHKLDGLIQKIAQKILSQKPQTEARLIAPSRIGELSNPQTDAKIQQLVATGHYTLESAKFCAENNLVKVPSKEEKFAQEMGEFAIQKRPKKKRA